MAVEVKYTQLFINNEWVNSASGKTFATLNPATEAVIAQVQEGDAADIDKAVKAARAAFEVGTEWRSMDASKRGSLLYKLAQLMRRDQDYIAKLESLDNGKVYQNSFEETGSAIGCIEHYAGWADKVCGKTIPADGPVFTYTRHEPVGVCGQIIPWNYPIILLAWKLGPALACGNTVIVKPAEQTPLTALYIAALVKEAGFPAGVVNVVPGYGATAGNALSMHMDVNKIAFTGSTLTGRKIQEASAKSNLKRVSLELGGKSPMIIMDADDETIAAAAQWNAGNMFHNNGQTCCAPSRAFVHEDVYDSYLEKVKKIAESVKVGDPFDKENLNGALISELQYNKVLDYIAQGKKEGARCITGGEKIPTKGYFIKPTVFADCTDDMVIAKEEIFGPVLSVFKFKDVNEAIRRANATSYGLAAGVYCKDINKVIPMVNALEAGSVWVNCFGVVNCQAPFGGYKQSGIGREMGEYGLQEYTEVKTVTIHIGTKSS